MASMFALMTPSPRGHFGDFCAGERVMTGEGQCEERTEKKEEERHQKFFQLAKKWLRELEVGAYPVSILSGSAALGEERLKPQAPAGLHRIDSPGAFEVEDVASR